MLTHLTIRQSHQTRISALLSDVRRRERGKDVIYELLFDATLKKSFEHTKWSLFAFSDLRLYCRQQVVSLYVQIFAPRQYSTSKGFISYTEWLAFYV